ncbi:hypothetical protein BDZ94DRAFT_782002 [Collybia nuda]|uniref:Uncharacterized protein n=1 Tax=Collybia nuda TaxID=64659 RepID=A0A9P5YIA1_9AGAR|nr:hypothetical protein BDZ94DRAFT_782002 [Collybia nuda]
MTSRSSLWLPFAIFLVCYWGVQVALADQVNVTIDDTDPTILYTPPESWRLSSVTCSTCLNPDTREALQGTFHDGTHLVPPPDDDGHGGGGGGGDLKILARWQKKRQPTFVSARRKGGPSETNTDVMVSALFNFTGSAVYLYCIQPLGIPGVGAAPTSMDLNFILDNNLVGNFSHQGSESASGYASHVNVFAQANLTEALHTLRVDVGLGSAFLFDYMIYTQVQDNHTNDTTPDVPNQNVDSNTKKRNVATFAGAIGGSVGVLAVISLCLALSIIKRRRNYNQRERRARDRSSLHTNASDDSPPMIGPAPFIPRFFPGTTVTSTYSDPPSYVESMSNPSPSSPPSFDVAISAILPAGSRPPAAFDTQKSSDKNVTSPDPVPSPSSPSSSSRVTY